MMKAAVQGRQDCVTALLLAGEHLPRGSPGFREGVALLLRVGRRGDALRCLQELTCTRWMP